MAIKLRRAFVTEPSKIRQANNVRVGKHDVLEEARRIQENAADSGFDWPDISGPLFKVTEELEEIREALDGGYVEEAKRELGDLLFAVINVARFLDADVAQELARTNDKFERRFARVREVIESEGLVMKDCTLEKLDAVWDRIKTVEE